ncbi:MAG: multicopper oxidase domain-containing protein [Tessaracoccus sp.]
MKVVISVLVLGAMVTFVPLMFGAIRHTVAERRRLAHGGDTRPYEEPRSIWTAGQLLAAVAALSVAVAAGVGIDPAAAGLSQPQTSQAAVAPTGEVVRVEVKALDMAYEPSVIEVDPGDQLIIELVNEDPTNFHDLMVGGIRSPRLGVGERTELDLGIIGESTEGWCTVAGHRQMGMTLQIVVGDTPVQSDGEHQGHETQARVTADAEAEIGRIVDPVLAPLTDETVHELTMTVTEEPLEVAPGVWQNRWTFNGSSVGPTLHGRVGDVFVITLINDGTMGHSIDFHAGALAPDEPMRTIAPGESLTYRFTAERAGSGCTTARRRP